MVKLIGFETREELSELTGLTVDELWDAGFDLDDWDIGFQSEIQLHRAPTQEELEEESNWYDEDTCLTDPDLPLWWLMFKMENYCVGFSHTEHDGKHYYLVHHA